MSIRLSKLLLLVVVLMAFSLSSFSQLTTVTTPDVSRCVSGNVQLNTVPSGGTSYTYSWSPTTALSNSTIANPVATPLATTTYVVTVTDVPTSNTVTDTVTITIQNVPPPLAIYPQSDTICAGDTIPLDVVNAPYCQGISGSCQSATSTATVGSGTAFGFTANDNPLFKSNNFFNQTRSTKHQYVYSKADLNAVGLVGPRTITAISWDLIVGFGNMTYNNLTFKMGCIPDTILTSTYKTNLTTVYNPKTVTFTTSGFNQFLFEQAYVWDGESSIVLEVCFANNSGSNNNPFVRVETVYNGIATFNSANFAICNNTTGSLNNRRPNTAFLSCQLVHDATLSYSWTPAAGLSSTSVKNPFASPTLSTNYILTTTDNNGCSMQDTVEISVAPDYNLSINNDTTLCLDDTLIVMASHNSGPGATYKWSAGSWIENDSIIQTRAYFNSNDQVYLNMVSAAGCSKSDSFMVNMTTGVEVDILIEDTSICAGDTIQMLVSTNSQSCSVNSSSACLNPADLSFSTTSTFPSGGVVVSPFDAAGATSTPGQKKQYLILASELSAMLNSTTINKLGFNVVNVGTSVTSRNGFTIKIGCTNVNAFPGFGANPFITGLSTVFTPKTINIGTGWNDLVFDSPYIWDGQSNIVIEICWQNSAALGFGFNTLNWTNTSFNSVMVNWNSSNICSATNSSFGSTIRPEMRLGHCESPPNPNYNYLWTPSVGLTSDTMPEPQAFPNTTTQYKLNVIDPLSGCQNEDSVLITVAPNFITNVSNDSTLCSDDTVSLFVNHNSILPVTYNWQPSNEVSDSSIFNPDIYVDGIKSVISEVRNSLGCIKWDTVNLGLFDQINLSIIKPAGPNCEGDSVQFDAVQSISCGQSNNALCSPSNTLVLGTSTTNSSSFNITPFIGTSTSAKRQILIRKSELQSAGLSASAQLASISFEITALGKSDYQNFVIKMGCVNSNSLGGTFNGGTTTVFDPKDVTLVAGKNWFDFDHRFNWDGQSNVLVEICYNNASTGSNSEISYTQSTPIFNSTVYTRGSSVCNSSSGTAYNRRPNLEFKYCIIAPSTFSYNWSPQGWYNDPGLINPMAVVNLPGWYKLALTDLTSNCVTEDSVQLTVMSFDLEALKDTTMCSSEGYQLDVTTTAVLPKYRWTPGNEVSNDTIRNPKVLIDNGTNYIVEITDSAGCAKMDTVTITLLPQPTAVATPIQKNVCRFESVQLIGSGGVTYSWSPDVGLSNSSISSPVAAVADSTIYYLTVTNGFGCTDEDSVILNVFPSPILDLGPDTSICNEGYLILDAGSDFETYRWQDNSNIPTYLVDQDGKYWVAVSDVYGCDFSDTVIISIAPMPRTDIEYITEICLGDSVILDAKNPGSKYLWSTGETTQTIVVRDSGFIWVEIDDGTCIGKDSTIAKVYEYPFSFLSDVEYYCEKEDPFGIYLTAGPDEYRYLWDNGQVTSSILVTSEGIYTVVITNGDKCSIEQSTQVKQVCSERILVPNSFTPNSDWTNDEFRIVASNMDEFEFRIFNRWGEMIFYSSSPDFAWDGTYKGNPVPEGVYVWRIDYKIKRSDGSYADEEESGSLTIIR